MDYPFSILVPPYWPFFYIYILTLYLYFYIHFISPDTYWLTFIFNTYSQIWDQSLCYMCKSMTCLPLATVIFLVRSAALYLMFTLFISAIGNFIAVGICPYVLLCCVLSMMMWSCDLRYGCYWPFRWRLGQWYSNSRTSYFPICIVTHHGTPWQLTSWRSRRSRLKRHIAVRLWCLERKQDTLEDTQVCNCDNLRSYI